LVHLRVLSVRRLRVAVAVTIWTVVCIAVGSRILSHALRKTWTLSAVLRRGIIAGGCGLIPNGRQLCVRRTLSWYTHGLSHLSVGRCFAWRTALMTLLCIGSVALIISLALGLFLLLLRLPFFANLFELCIVDKSATYRSSVKYTPR
jgi:hypothetical protein